MRSLAEVLHAAGWSISGSDPRADALARRPFRVATAHDPQQINTALDLVVHSVAVPADNPELARARELGLDVVSYPQLLGQLLPKRHGAAVAGTHGKSTTTALAGEILTAAGLDPTVVFGASAHERASASRLGRGHWLLAEACEYRANFLELRPRVAALLGIEHDHVDCYATPADVEAAFARFANQVPADGVVLARADCAATRRVVAGLEAAVETFGLSTDAMWRATALRERRGYYSFELRHRRRLVCEVKLSLPGIHNVQNALAAAALASHCGAGGSAIRAGLARFAGLHRRLDRIADGSVAVIDDYAHHPTAVAAALSTVRQIQPDRRLVCVFEPHQGSRTTTLLDGFAKALHNADKLIVTDVYRARETGRAAGDEAQKLVERMVAHGTDARYLPLSAIKEELLTGLRAGDVIVTLGAGDIGALAHDLGQRFRVVRQAG